MRMNIFPFLPPLHLSRLPLASGLVAPSGKISVEWLRGRPWCLYRPGEHPTATPPDRTHPLRGALPGLREPSNGYILRGTLRRTGCKVWLWRCESWPSWWRCESWPNWRRMFEHVSLVSQQRSRSRPSSGASLEAQWLRIRLLMQRTWVWALVWEDPTCRGATKLVCHNYWAPEPQLLSLCATTTEACPLRACAPQQEKPPQGEAHARQRRVAPARRN